MCVWIRPKKAMTLRIIMVTAGDAPFGDFMGGSGPKADSPSHLKHRGGTRVYSGVMPTTSQSASYVVFAALSES